MKKFDLNAYGVEEMNVVQLQEIEGGSWVKVVIFILEIIDALIDKEDTYL